MMNNISPNLWAQINKHPTFSYKECYLDEDEKVVVVFYFIEKDDAGYDSFVDFFVTDLQGVVLCLEDHKYEQLKRCI